MANTILKAEKIAAAAVGLLERELILGNLINRNGEDQFTGAKNDTITIRVPARLDAREYNWRNDRSAEIVMDDLVEDSVTITLNRDYYVAVPVTDEELSLDIVDFGAQVLSPQVQAIAHRIDDEIANLIESAPYETTLEIDTANPYKTVVAARKALNNAHVDHGGRILLVGSDVEELILLNDRFSKASDAGDSAAQTRLAEATLGRIAGFTAVASTAIDPGAAYAFVPSAFSFATRAPMVPAGATFGASVTHENLAMRWVRDYDAAKMRDRSVVNLFAGFNYMTDRLRGEPPAVSKRLLRAVKLTMPVETP